MVGNNCKPHCELQLLRSKTSITTSKAMLLVSFGPAANLCRSALLQHHKHTTRKHVRSIVCLHELKSAGLQCFAYTVRLCFL
jgi:hypothetical protein